MNRNTLDPLQAARDFTRNPHPRRQFLGLAQRLAAVERRASRLANEAGGGGEGEAAAVAQVDGTPEITEDDVGTFFLSRYEDRQDALSVAVSASDGSPLLVKLDTYSPQTEEYVYAAKIGSQGTANGQFDIPLGVAVEDGGAVWVCDRRNERMQKFDANLAYVSQFGAAGSGNGQFALNSGPHDVAIDQAGNLFVTDSGNQRVQKFSGAGVYLSQFGSAGTGNGQFSSAEGPGSIAIHRATGRIYVADPANRRIQYFTSAGVYEGQWGAFGAGDGQFQDPTGVAADQNDGTVYVADRLNQRVQAFSATGGFLRKWGTGGKQPGQFLAPAMVEINPVTGSVLVTDLSRHDIQEFTPNGVFLRRFGRQGQGDGQFLQPYGLGLDATGTILYVGDSLLHRVQKLVETIVPAPVLGLDGLDDVTIEAPAANHRLTYDATLGEWKNVAAITPAITARTNSGNVGANAGATVTATCNAGEVAIGGGGSMASENTSTNTRMALSVPVGSPPTSWKVGFFNASGSSQTITCYAVCMATPLS